MIIERLPGAVPDEDRSDLIALLTDCVAAGASIGFLAPLAWADADAYWSRVIAGVKTGSRVLLVARQALQDAGARRLKCFTRDT